MTSEAGAAGARWDRERDRLDRGSSERRQESRPGFYPEGDGKPMKGDDWLVFRKNHFVARRRDARENNSKQARDDVCSGLRAECLERQRTRKL